jgi:hypothetical protein
MGRESIEENFEKIEVRRKRGEERAKKGGEGHTCSAVTSLLVAGLRLTYCTHNWPSWGVSRCGYP